MNKIAAALAVIALTPVFAEQAPRAGAVKCSPEQRQQMIYQRTGGIVRRAREGKCVYIVNSQKKVARGVIREIADAIENNVSFPVVIVDSDAKPGTFSDKDAGFAVYVTEGGARLLAAPEDAWSAFDVDFLLSDSPAPAVVAARVSKQLWKALVYGLGGGNSNFQKCAMKPAFSLAEIDAIEARSACPENYQKITESAGMLGIKPVRRASYLMACREGWAPAPTNDYQKVIWEKVKAEANTKPSNPIKIVKPAK